jgi:dihydrofolate reductase
MAELLSELIVSVDTFAKGKKSPGYFGYDGAEFGRWLKRKNAQPHRNLLGRKTYKVLSSLPDEAKDDAYNKMANDEGWVFSTKLKKVEWPGLAIVSGDLEKNVRKWKKGDGPEIRTLGSLSVVRQLVAAGLVDRFRLIMCPLVLPKTGLEKVFKGYEDIEFELLDTEILDGRIIVLDYKPTGKPPSI